MARNSNAQAYKLFVIIMHDKLLYYHTNFWIIMNQDFDEIICLLCGTIITTKLRFMLFNGIHSLF